uniref:BTB domain-containing protein n=1 Tax=Rhabditophanes sp. KR3021 TaxID=114890 RepID=A0AC35U8X6_9BILA
MSNSIEAASDNAIVTQTRTKFPGHLSNFSGKDQILSQKFGSDKNEQISANHIFDFELHSSSLQTPFKREVFSNKEEFEVIFDAVPDEQWASVETLTIKAEGYKNDDYDPLMDFIKLVLTKYAEKATSIKHVIFKPLLNDGTAKENVDMVFTTMSGLTSISTKKITVDWTNLKDIDDNLHDATMFNILLGFFYKKVTAFEIDVGGKDMDYIKFVTDFKTALESYIGEEYNIYKVNLIFTNVGKLNEFNEHFKEAELKKVEKYFNLDMNNEDKVEKGSLCNSTFVLECDKISELTADCENITKVCLNFKSMDEFLIKEFIYTAFTNLKEIEISGISDSNINRAKETILSMPQNIESLTFKNCISFFNSMNVKLTETYPGLKHFRIIENVEVALDMNNEDKVEKGSLCNSTFVLECDEISELTAGCGNITKVCLNLKSMDESLIKEFIYTAFTNLREIEISGISDSNINRAKEIILSMPRNIESLTFKNCISFFNSMNVKLTETYPGLKHFRIIENVEVALETTFFEGLDKLEYVQISCINSNELVWPSSVKVFVSDWNSKIDVGEIVKKEDEIKLDDNKTQYILNGIKSSSTFPNFMIDTLGGNITKFVQYKDNEDFKLYLNAYQL